MPPVEMSPADAKFLQDMIVHHKAALAMSQEFLRLSPAKRQMARVSELAKNIIEAQTGEIREMSLWLQQAGRPITASRSSGGSMSGMSM